MNLSFTPSGCEFHFAPVKINSLPSSENSHSSFPDGKVGHLVHLAFAHLLNFQRAFHHLYSIHSQSLGMIQGTHLAGSLIADLLITSFLYLRHYRVLSMSATGHHSHCPADGLLALVLILSFQRNFRSIIFICPSLS